MDVSYTIHDVQSGALVGEVEPVAGGWTRGAVTVGEFTFLLRGDSIGTGRTAQQARDVRRNLFRTWDRAIVVAVDGVPVYAGLIVGRPYSPGPGYLTVKHVDARILMQKRFLFGVGWYDPAGVFDWRGYSTRGVVRQCYYYGLVHPYSAAWPINADVGGAEMGSSPEARYYHSEFQSPDSIVQAQSDRANGLDSDLHPEFRSGALWWMLRIGTPFLSGDPAEVRADELVATDKEEDALSQATGIFVKGSGSEQDMKVGSAALPSTVAVSRDYAISAKDVTDVAFLNSLAQGRLDGEKDPRAEWSFKAWPDSISPAKVRPGSVIKVTFEDDEWEDDGAKDWRVLQFSGRVGSEQISYEVEAV